MYAVEVRDRIMIAHSFKGDLFGPAQSLHGATFVVDVAFFREELTEDAVVVDIGRAHEALSADAEAAATTRISTRCRNLPAARPRPSSWPKHIFDAMAAAARAGHLGPGSEGVAHIRVTLHESDVARAWYEGAPA